VEQLNPKVRELLGHIIDELNQNIHTQGTGSYFEVETYIDLDKKDEDKLLLEMNKIILEMFEER
jgi:hypothetical protein